MEPPFIKTSYYATATGKLWRGCDQPHPVVLQPFDSVSQRCPTFHSDNTTIVHMGKYQNITVFSWSHERQDTLLSLVRLPKQLRLTLHTQVRFLSISTPKYLTFSSQVLIHLAGYESVQPHTFYVSCLEPSVEFY